MRVLVTGASGFVGRHLVPHLLAHGHEVRATGRAAVPPPRLPNCVPWVGGLDLAAGADPSPALVDVDAVVHLAARAHRTSASERSEWQAYQRVNVQATRALATAVAGAAQIRRLVFLSSIGAVCSRASTPVSEATPPAPDTAYGQSKLEAERAMATSLEASAADWVTLRPPLVYGPGNPGNMERLLRVVRQGLPLPVGGIANRRSLLFIGNLIDAIRIALQHEDVGRQIFHVADPTAVSTPDLVRKLARTAGVPVRLWALPSEALKIAGRVGDGIRRIAGVSVGIDSYVVNRLQSSLLVDAGLFCRITGWSQPFDLDEGLMRTFGRSPRGGADT